MNKQEEGKMKINKVGGGEKKMKKRKREKKTDQEVNSARSENLIAMMMMMMMMMMIHVFWDVTPCGLLLSKFLMAVTPSFCGSKNEKYVPGLLNPKDEDRDIRTLVRIRQSTHSNIPEDLNLQKSSPYLYCL